MITFDYCALQFFNQWMTKESIYCDLISSNLQSDRLRALEQGGQHFRIMRNIPVRYDIGRGLFRCEPVLDVLDKFSESDLTTVSIPEFVDTIQQEISGLYGNKNVLSLSSKFLWLKFKSPICIYDRQARLALGTKNGDYTEFYDAFHEFFDKNKHDIINSCNSLKNVISFSANPDIEHNELINLISSNWFRERVLDIYLWHKGNV